MNWETKRLGKVSFTETDINRVSAERLVLNAAAAAEVDHDQQDFIGATWFAKKLAVGMRLDPDLIDQRDSLNLLQTLCETVPPFIGWIISGSEEFTENGWVLHPLPVEIIKTKSPRT
jgi:hypothetical protein